MSSPPERKGRTKAEVESQLPAKTEIVRRIAPLLGMRPDFDPASEAFSSYVEQASLR